MKKLTLLALVFTFSLISSNLFAQYKKNITPPLTLYSTESGSYIFDTIIKVDSISKSELYERAKDWIISSVRGSSKDITFDDENNDDIITDVSLDLTCFNNVRINVTYKLALYFKDNKCKITTTSFFYSALATGRIYENDFSKIKIMGKKKVYRTFDKDFTTFKNSLIQSLYTAPDNTDW